MNYLKFTSDGNLLLTFYGKDYTISTLEEWDAASAEIAAHELYPIDHTLMCSSSIDFPDEYTNDEVLIAICDAVRGG